ncbi:MAG TPA: hypothetical protein VLG28_16885 [Acidimicrobiia bacterium]|nr:hypothetical protein [Acidimicrobiia bacterium]
MLSHEPDAGAVGVAVVSYTDVLGEERAEIRATFDASKGSGSPVGRRGRNTWAVLADRRAHLTTTEEVQRGDQHRDPGISHPDLFHHVGYPGPLLVVKDPTVLACS